LADSDSTRVMEHQQQQSELSLTGGGASSWDTVTQQYVSVKDHNSQTSWTTSTHQRTLHVSYQHTPPLPIVVGLHLS